MVDSGDNKDDELYNSSRAITECLYLSATVTGLLIWVEW
jgi:hypothetical protein